MSTIVQTPGRADYLHAGHTIGSWLTTTDHKRIAVLYMISITFFFFLGSIAALLVRLELLTPAGDLLSHDGYNKAFTLHGVIMVWFFLIPSIPTTFGNFLVPLMLGARDLAFPRLNLASWYLYVIGGLFTLGALLLGGVDTGWTFYTPYSSMFSNTHVVAVIVGVFVVGFSSIFTAINIIVTTHQLRAPGMTWFRMPLFIWSHYAVSVVMLLATPVLTITLVLLAMERVLGIGIFDPALGGDPLLFQHLFWFYSHPAVYIMVLPALGVMSELITAFSHKRIFGYAFVAFSSIAIAVLSFMVWGHHMFVSGQSMYAGFVFSFLSYAVAVPSAIKVYNWTATLYKGRIELKAPLLYALGFIGLFVAGGTPHPGRTRRRRARPRHLFRRRPLPLHHGRRHGECLHGRSAFLVAQDLRTHVFGVLGSNRRAYRLSRLQLDLFPAVHPGLPRHAQALSRLSAGVSVLPRPVFGRGPHPRLRLSAAALLSDMVTASRRAGRCQSLGCSGTGMDGVVTAAQAQFQGDPDGRARGLHLSRGV